jgi:hypothetical protein
MTYFQPSRRLRAGLGLAAAVGLFCLVGPPSARAWNGPGHMAVAEIAYDNLKPKTRANVDALLLRHKDYAKWMADMPAGFPNKSLYAFERAATWPDDVRKTDDDRPIWHYVDVPVIAPGYKPDPIAIMPVTPNAETQITVESGLLSDTKTADGDRAVALCWVEHLVGDIHQPLHTASLFSAQFPKGDKGGNSDLLAPNAVAGDPVETVADPHNLHALWDDMLGKSRDPQDIQKIVTRLEGPDFARKKFPQIGKHKTVHDWVLESNALARDVVYVGGNIPLTPDGEKADVTLPAGYLPAAHALADRQIALAGLRLADLLNATRFPAVTAPPTPLAPAVTPSTTSPATPATVAQGQIIGNKRTMAYHLPGDTGQLPAEKNRVYFATEAEAVKAGYHPSGG